MMYYAYLNSKAAWAALAKGPEQFELIAQPTFEMCKFAKARGIDIFKHLSRKQLEIFNSDQLEYLRLL